MSVVRRQIADKAKISDEVRTELQKKIQAQKEEDLRMVRGIFKNLECPNGFLKFSYKKYKGESVRTYSMFDGKEYEVPLYIAKHLNNNCCYPVHANSIGADGTPCESIGKMVNRFAFISTEYR